jgi:hypothetical protein
MAAAQHTMPNTENVGIKPPSCLLKKVSVMPLRN